MRKIIFAFAQIMLMLAVLFNIPIAYALTGTHSEMDDQTVNVGALAVGGSVDIGDYSAPVDVTVALAASATTDGMDITVTAVDGDGDAIADVFQFDLWMSEAATCAGHTGDTYSGTLTAGTGLIVDTQVAKKAFRLQTAATGIFVGTLVDSGNPADQYVCVQHPLAGGAIPSAASGTSWEGA